MSTEGIVLLLGGIGTFIGAMVGAYRLLSGDRFQRKVTESAALLTGYTEMVTNLRKDMTAMRESHSTEQERLQRQHRTELEGMALLHKEERERWAQERDELRERIDELEGKVTALMFRPEGMRERRDDR